MKSILAATAALGLALTAAPAMADDHMDGHMMEMSAQQQGMYDTWPADRRAMYDGWPHDAQMYFWTLEPMQMDGWWMLNNDQRLRIVAMNPQQRMAAWQSINAQMGGSSSANTAMARTSASANMNSNVRFVSNEMVQSAPAAHNGEYPLCTDGRTDNCMNPWEAGKRGAGVTRPLDYWPGKPASEM